MKNIIFIGIIAVLLVSLGLASLGSSRATLAPPAVAAADTPSPAPTAGLDLSNAVLIGTEEGLNILDKNGISVLNKDLDAVEDILVDKQGRVWAIDSGGLNVFDGQSWMRSQLPKGVYSSHALAFDSKGRLWLGHYEGVSVLEGGQWITYGSDKFGLGEYADLVRDVAVDNQDRVWVATASGVAVFDGAAWKHYDETSGLTDDSLEAVAVDAEGKIWLGHTWGVDVFNGSNWTYYGDKSDKTPKIKTDKLFQAKALDVDDRGTIWVGTYGNGVSYFDGNSWKTYDDRENFHGGSVKSVYCDPTGRTWLGTDSGLAVYDGRDWRQYTKNTSNLLSCDIRAVMATGSGPPSLPPTQELKNGTVTGKCLKDEQPVAGAQVVVCDKAHLISSGDSPIEGDSYSSATDANGAFLINDIPPNRYDLAVKTSDGKWHILMGSVHVLDGETEDLGKLSLK